MALHGTLGGLLDLHRQRQRRLALAVRDLTNGGEWFADAIGEILDLFVGRL